MVLKKYIVTSLFVGLSVACMAQGSFDTTTIYHQKSKLHDLYNELMLNAGAINTINTDTITATSSGFKVVDVEEGGLEGEATFVYEVGEDGERINTYITQFWSYSDNKGEPFVIDYIIFVDGDTVGFDREKLARHKIDRSSRNIIKELFDYVEQTRKFEMIRPRERNLKYERVRFK